MLFKGNSSRLEHLIEKIQANKENHEVSADDIKGLSCFIIFNQIDKNFLIILQIL